MRRIAITLTTCLFLICCPGTSPDDGGTQDAGTQDAGGDGDGDGDTCPNSGSAGLGVIVEHPFSRTCSVAADCAVVEVQRDCCGTRNAFAVAADDEPALTSWGGTCSALFPECDCAGQPTRADDGTQSPTLGDTASARCLSGVCVSTYEETGTGFPQCFDIPAAQATFDRTCASVADCVAAPVFGGCCGEIHVLGVSRVGEPSASLWSASCLSEAVCDCVPFESTADDGTTGPVNGEGAAVGCTENVCVTTFPSEP